MFFNMTIVPFAIFLTLCVFAVQSHQKFNPPDFSGFERCLLDNSAHSENLVWRSNSSRYVNLNYQWQQKGTYRYPRAYVLVHNDLDVTRVIRCGKKHWIHLVPKGGGHTLDKYSFGDKSSVIVDVQYLTKVSVDKVNSRARVGSGHLIGPLQWHLWTTAEAFIPLGDCPSVGVAGLTLGGGWGSFSQILGMSLDNLLGITVVLANSSVCKTSSEKYQDLFWALRGAGSTSFGIVTSFTFRLFPALPTVFLGRMYYKIGALQRVYAAWQAYTAKPSDRISVILFLSLTELYVRVIDPTGQASNFETIQKRFPRAIKVTRENFTHPEFLFYEATKLTFQDPSEVYGLDRPSDLANVARTTVRSVYIKRKSFFVSRQIDTKSIVTWALFLATLPPSISVWFEGYGAKVSAVKVNDTEFVHRGDMLYNAVANYRQVDPSRKEVASRRIWLREFFAIGYQLFRHNESYQNYVDGDLKNFNKRYYGRNLPKLIELKRKYDPDNFFHNPQSIPTE